MMRDKLRAIASPVLDEIKEHPFWKGLHKGTLPADSLWYFAELDARYVVPTYARALARCAATADSDAHGSLLASAAHATFGSLPRLVSELEKLGVALGARPDVPAGVPGPAIQAYISFMRAASAMSFVSGIGGLLPMTWFHLQVCDYLREGLVPGSRYADWIHQYCPEDSYYREYVEAYLGIVDEVAGQCSADECDQLVAQFTTAAHHELAFVDAAWRCEAWVV